MREGAHVRDETETAAERRRIAGPRVTANPWPGRAALGGLVLLVAAVAVDGESHDPANLSGKSAT